MGVSNQPGTTRRLAITMQRTVSPATVFDRLWFLAGTAAAVWLAVVIALQAFRHPWSWLVVVPIWAITAYLVLPRLHRMLSDIYVPDYFFGRTRTADGLLGDPVNLALDGTREQLDAAMSRAGWHRADEITAASTWGIIVSTLLRRSYPTAPVSPLMLFNRRHDVAYQQEVEGNPKQRHHVRFWHCPPGWMLPGGQQVDWLGAATYDTDVGLSLFTLQVTHRIDENTDVERDFVIDSMRAAEPEISTTVLRDFTSGYHARNGGGDRFITDGDLPIVDLTRVTADVAPEPKPTDLVHRTPLSVMVAVVVIAISALTDVFVLWFDPSVRAFVETERTANPWIASAVAIALTALAAAQLAMAWAVLHRSNRARIILMLLLTLTIIATAIAYLDGSEALRFNSTLVTASTQCFALLALSSDGTGEWFRTRRRPAEE